MPSPAKIWFLSQEFSGDIVQEALSLDAQGYVHKCRAQSELLPAIDAILAGKRFIGSALENHEFSEKTEASAASKLKGTVAIVCEKAQVRTAPKYPWQQAVMEAFESPRDSLAGKINLAERAIATRLIDADQLGADERLALRDALRSQNVLIEETRLKAPHEKDKGLING